MKNLEECVDELTELGRLELDFEIQIIRSNRCLELCDAYGSDRWNKEAQNTLDKIKEYFRSWRLNFYSSRHWIKWY